MTLQGRTRRFLALGAIAIGHFAVCTALGLLVFLAAWQGREATLRVAKALLGVLLSPLILFAGLFARGALDRQAALFVTIGSSLIWAPLLLHGARWVGARWRRAPRSTAMAAAGLLGSFLIATVPDWHSPIRRLRQQGLTLAASHGSVIAMRALLSLGADPDGPAEGWDPEFFQPISAAAATGDLIAVRFLLDHGARSTRTALENAVRSGQSLELVRLLIQSGVSCRGLDRRGVPLLIPAVRRRDLETVDVLLGCGAEPGVAGWSDRTWTTPLEVAQAIDAREILERLRRAPRPTR